MAATVNAAKWKSYVGGRPVTLSLINARKGLMYVIDVTLNENYATGGIPVELKQHGAKTINWVFVSKPSRGESFTVDISNGKIQVWNGVSEMTDADTTFATTAITLSLLVFAST